MTKAAIIISAILLFAGVAAASSLTSLGGSDTAHGRHAAFHTSTGVRDDRRRPAGPAQGRRHQGPVRRSRARKRSSVHRRRGRPGPRRRRRSPQPRARGNDRRLLDDGDGNRGRQLRTRRRRDTTISGSSPPLPDSSPSRRAQEAAPPHRGRFAIERSGHNSAHAAKAHRPARRGRDLDHGAARRVARPRRVRDEGRNDRGGGARPCRAHPARPDPPGRHAPGRLRLRRLP